MWWKMNIKVTFRLRKLGRLLPLKTFGLRMDYWPKDSCTQVILDSQEYIAFMFKCTHEFIQIEQVSILIEKYSGIL